MKKYLFLLALCLTAGTLRAASPEEEMRTVRERMVRASYETAHTHSRLQRIIREKLSRAQNSDNIVETVREDKSDENVRRFLESMAADGSWSELDYADKRRSSWSPCEHARRVMLMSCAYANPEDINSSPDKAPSKRLLAIHANYDKILEGNLIALCVGIDTILNRCPRFKNWIEKLIAACHD